MNGSKQGSISQPKLLLDLYNIEARYKKWLQKIENDETIFSPKDKEDIQRFIAQMDTDGLSLLRRIKYFSFLYQIRRHLNKPFRDVTREDIEVLIKEMVLDGKIYKTQDSIQSFRALLKRFYKFLLGNNEELPEQVRFVTRMKIRKELSDENVILCGRANHSLLVHHCNVAFLLPNVHSDVPRRIHFLVFTS